MSRKQPSQLLSPARQNISRSISKRPRSPDLERSTAKRTKAAPQTPVKDREDERERRKAEREAQKEEFRVKYTRHFPSWTFHFDIDHCGKEGVINDLKGKITQLGGAVDDFFSSNVTHLITNQPIPVEKENNPKSRAVRSASAISRSPSRARTRDELDTTAETLTVKALSFGMKIWSVDKLGSVLARCLSSTALSTPTPASSQTLNRLLKTERMLGTTSERDPSAKRHDFRYFSKNSVFLLVEDMRGELATIAAQEYTKTRGDGYKPQFPILHCHPHARGPFIPFDEKEKRRYERSQRIEKEKEAEQEKLREKERLRRMAEAQKQYRKPMDLRRSVSMSNLQNQYQQDIIDYDETVAPDSANASGYLASGTGGYIAASGNSVGITSTTGTTSTGGNNPLRTAHLPASLRAQAQREVVTSRKATLRNAKRSNMGPPEEIPDRPHVLRKSRSTNTMRLPKREEGSKPGYCESCRTKFDDFKVHIKSKKHRKFADNNENFAQLDQVLARVRRRTIREVEQENMTFLMNKQREKERMALQNQQVSPFKPDDHDPDDVFRDDF